MYFLLADLIHRFIYLKAGLAVVLVFVGVKMIVSHALWKIPTVLSLSVVHRHHRDGRDRQPDRHAQPASPEGVAPDVLEADNTGADTPADSPAGTGPTTTAPDRLTTDRKRPL